MAMRFLWKFCLALLIAGNAYALDTNTYQVNMVVFTHITPKTLMSEQWQPILIQPKTSMTTQPQFLPKNQCALNREARQINRRRDYILLANVCWQQIIPDNTTSPAMTIASVEKIGEINQLLGTIELDRYRYFNVKLNLMLTEPQADLASIAEASYANSISNNNAITFQLLQTRRMKSGELNYIAHQLFGVLIKITKVIEPSPPLVMT